MVVTDRLTLPPLLNPRHHYRSERSTCSSTSCHDHGFTTYGLSTRLRTLHSAKRQRLFWLCTGSVYCCHLYCHSTLHHITAADVLSVRYAQASSSNMQQSASLLFQQQLQLPSGEFLVLIALFGLLCSDFLRILFYCAASRDNRWNWELLFRRLACLF